MKLLYNLFVIMSLTIAQFCYPQVARQQSTDEEIRNDPIILKVKSHEPNFKGFKSPYLSKVLSTKSFYKQKDQWRHIIDSMWGPGLPTAQKLQIFDDYATHLHDEFDGFQSLGMSWASWDSVRSYWRSKITDSTSRGIFSGIMSRFAFSFLDGHVRIWDDSVVQTSLNPGVPVLCIGGYFDEGSISHFGTVLTALPDNNLLVLKVVDNHPLNLQPGDIILGYEGSRWDDLVQELLHSELPVYGLTVGSASARDHEYLISAGMNWHLFDTIDVVRHSSGDTLHLPLQPMIILSSPPIVNSEQLPVAGVPFPDFFNNQDVSYGTIEGTNIGYIYLYIESWSGMGWPSPYAEEELYVAVNALKDKDALIFDLRYNLGGYAKFADAFRILFNRHLYTIEHSYRCNTSDQSLCPRSSTADLHDIPGQPPGFDRPIAVLLGPTNGSDGEITAYQLRYHDMVRVFGKPSAGCLGFVTEMTQYAGWMMCYSRADPFLVSNPEVYLNRKEFPIDYPVWFNADDVANGIDPVVQKAVEWINTVVYAHDVKISNGYYTPGIGEAEITATVENPLSHSVSAEVFIESKDNGTVDSIDLSPAHKNGNGLWSGTWNIPNSEDTYTLKITTTDHTNGNIFPETNVQRFTTKGPAVLDSLAIIPINATQYRVKPYFKNYGITDTLKSLKVILETNNPWVTKLNYDSLTLVNIVPGAVVTPFPQFQVTVDTAIFTRYFNLDFTITSEDWPYWKASALPTLDTIPHIVQQFNQGWNLISLLLEVFDPRVEKNYHSTLSPAYEYKGYYRNCDSLTVGSGYWLKIGDGTQYVLWGDSVYQVTVEVATGWNLIGSISEPIAASSIICDPPGIVTSSFWGYNGSRYFETDIINPGKGYWVKVNQRGSLILSSGTVMNTAARIKIIPTSEMPPPAPYDGTNSIVENQIPKEYRLEQNYPNPFNPTTVINYSVPLSAERDLVPTSRDGQLPLNSYVTLKVYNLLGQEVATLVNEIQDPGYKSVTWDAHQLPSGIYFYRLIAGRYVETKKLLLLR